MWETGCQLSGAGAARKIQWKAASIGTHHEARKFRIALSAGEAAQATTRKHPEWRSKYLHLALRRGRNIAKVAMARRLAVRLYWMWREGRSYQQTKSFGSHAGQPGNPYGVQ